MIATIIDDIATIALITVLVICKAKGVSFFSFNKTTKTRLDELESTKENLETEIAKENISHPLLTKEFLYSWFDGFKNFDVNKLKNRKILIDTFVNSVVFYDDRIDFYFNFKDNAKSLTLSEFNTVSDLSSSSPPLLAF